MEDSSLDSMHPAKRRKILPKPEIEYLTLAHFDVEVAVTELETRANYAEFAHDPAVSIVSVAAGTQVITIEVTAPWLQRRTILTAKYEPHVGMVLDDCTRLIPRIKADKDHTKAALACYNAQLYVSVTPIRLSVRILWHDTSAARDRIHFSFREIFSRYDRCRISVPSASAAEPWDVREFYDNVHVPLLNQDDGSDFKIDALHCELYKFQRRAVGWLLSREHVSVKASGQVRAKAQDHDNSQLPLGFHATKDASATAYYANPAVAVACSSKEEVIRRYDHIRGGLLAEAMGLGKTVEMIALICLHNMANSPHATSTPTTLRRSPATLIITPPSILDQWQQEIQGHAPSLHVYIYEGTRANSKRARDAVIEELCNQDVVLTTYNVIAKELYYVMKKPDRALRDRPRQEPPRSPLDQIIWWRVCLDEAQMIESGVSAAARVARLIPRVHAWAVTGTPIKQSHKDLFGLLLFLGYEPWCNSLKQWEYLVSNHRPLFRQMMGQIAIRHSKELVRDELRLPPQSRHTISVAFTNIEQAHYAQLFYEMCQDVGLTQDGMPVAGVWDLDSSKTVEKMRTWLTRLRQTCLHPEVGGRNRRALGRHNGPLRTVEQVLDVMIEQTETSLRGEQRNMLMQRVRQGQIHENAKDQDEALRLYSEAYSEACEAVEGCRKALEAELHLQKSRGKEKVREVVPDADDDSEVEDKDSPLTSARQRLRSALEVKHVCIFFTGNIYFQLKSDEDKVKPDSDQFTALEKLEAGAYELAKTIRGELLQEAVRKANRKTAAFKIGDNETELVAIPQMALDLDYTGIESRKIYEKLYNFCESMNSQAEQFGELRKKMVRFLQQALIDEDEGVELQGDEYENSTKHQDEMYAYMEALRAIFADRSDAITGQENILIRVEMKNFLNAAKDGEGPAPELMIKLMAEREAKRVRIEKQGSLRGIVAELRALVSSLQWAEAAGQTRARAEIVVADSIFQHATALMAIQNKALTGLEQEVSLFRNSVNARLEYYKALQKISDTVAPYREEDVGKPLDRYCLDRAIGEEIASRNKYSTLLAKSRYLSHLKADSTSEGVDRLCTICQSEFETGTITSCGHVFCKDDIQLWYREHGNCPVCKRRLRPADFFDITYKPSEMAVQAETVAGSSSPHASSDRPVSDNSIYSDVGTSQLNEIKNIELRGSSFGSKVDTICRHLQWLRERDAGCKTLVFSQFREVLDILGRAFRQNNISYTKCDDKHAIHGFKANPAIEVFLLHARAHSAGLNLVVASHVILCEPLINTALELQAIARVHRIGQHRPTTVWVYLIADTVEESIHDISVQRRLAHIKSRDLNLRSGTQTPTSLQESTIDAANSKELQAADLSKALAPGKNGGEMVNKDDVWPCLFGKSNRNGSRLGFLDAPAEAAEAGSEVGRFLRVDAAERRRND